MDDILTVKALNAAYSVIHAGIEDADFSEAGKDTIRDDFRVYLYDRGLPETINELQERLHEAARAIGFSIQHDYKHGDMNDKPATARLLINTICTRAFRAAESAMNASTYSSPLSR